MMRVVAAGTACNGGTPKAPRGRHPALWRTDDPSWSQGIHPMARKRARPCLESSRPRDSAAAELAVPATPSLSSSPLPASLSRPPQAVSLLSHCCDLIAPHVLCSCSCPNTWVAVCLTAVDASEGLGGGVVAWSGLVWCFLLSPLAPPLFSPIFRPPSYPSSPSPLSLPDTLSSPLFPPLLFSVFCPCATSPMHLAPTHCPLPLSPSPFSPSPFRTPHRFLPTSTSIHSLLPLLLEQHDIRTTVTHTRNTHPSNPTT